MYKSSNSQFIRWLSFFLFLSFSIFFTSLTAADQNYAGNVSSGEGMMSMSALDSIDLPFDPNVYTFLIYNPGGDQSSIEDAMDNLGIPYDERGFVGGVIVEVTPNDLATHDILIVGWNAYENTTGLHSDDLAAGILQNK